MPRLTKVAWLEKEIVDQKKWIAEHGGDLVGYVRHYGSKNDADHFGDGGEAIYAADMNHLTAMETRYQKLTQSRAVPGNEVIEAFRHLAGFVARVVEGAPVTRQEAEVAGRVVLAGLIAAGGDCAFKEGAPSLFDRLNEAHERLTRGG